MAKWTVVDVSNATTRHNSSLDDVRKWNDARLWLSNDLTVINHDASPYVD